MRQRFSGQTFTNLRSLGTGRTYGDLDLERVKFNGCVLAQYDDSQLGLVVRDVTMSKSSATNCVLHAVRFEDVTVDGLSLSKLHQLAACVFRHVTLKGRIGP